MRLTQLERDIDGAMRCDQHRLRTRLRALAKDARPRAELDGDLARLREQVAKSVEVCRQRQAGVPAVKFEGELPIVARREEIAAAIESHPVVIVSGETGSGKSTQIPKICLQMGRGVAGLIGHTQPRRIAARSIAARVAEELAVPLGREVGYKTRLSDTTGPQTYIKLMTDGILLAESLHDRYLDHYDTIILDEAHERSLNIDFLLGYLKRILPQRPDLKLIITSATIDAERFSRHFALPGHGAEAERPAPVIHVAGRTYPVEIRYRPVAAEEEGGEADLQRAVLDAVDELWSADRGDILIFMPTERDIHETSRALRGRLLHAGQQTEVLPLYARLSEREHARVFQPHAHRRIVIATNVAESSLTVPGIRFVVDAGTARISRYSARSQTQRLPIEPISRASADQRAGRCGRIAPGVCIRLYAEADYQTRDQYTAPEIQRTNLAAVILQAKAMRLGELEDYPFLDPPKPGTIRDGQRTLFELGAIDADDRLTPLGKQLARLPVDPRIGRMILAAAEEHCLAELLVLGSILELQDPRERPPERREAADERHAQFADAESDFLSLLKLWDFYHRLKEKLSRNQLRKACAQNFLSYNRMCEWLEIHRQLLRIVGEAGLKPQPRRDDYAAMHRAILTGLLTGVASRGEGYEYAGAGGRKGWLWPGSGLKGSKPKWIVAAESVETTRRYLRCCARIDPQWIEPLAPHLVVHEYGETHWDRASGSALAYERVTLLGLPIVPRRRIRLGPIDPLRARELLIADGLVGGEIDLKADFFVANRRLRDEVEQCQKKLRRLDLFLGDPACCEFYHARIPADVYDLPRLNQWLRTLDQPQRQRLRMSAGDLLREDVGDDLQERFPDELCCQRLRLPLQYAFAPGGDDDGVTVGVPLEAVHQLDEQQLLWLVPGLLENKLVALLRSLPKNVRRNLVPAPDVAKRVLPAIRFGEGRLLDQLAAALRRLAGEDITPDMFRLDTLPAELRMNIRVVDADGQTVAQGRDLDALRAQLGAETAAGLAAAADPAWHRDGITAWDFDDLPAEVEVVRRGLRLKAYPGLIDQGAAAGLRLFDAPLRAEQSTRQGLRRLIVLACGKLLQKQVQWLPNLRQWLVYATLLEGGDLRGQLADLLADRGLLADRPLPRSKADFEARLRSAPEQVAAAVQEVVPVVGPILEAYQAARAAGQQLTSPRVQDAAADIDRQLRRLTPPGFFCNTPWQWLTQFPRYFRAVVARIERLQAGDTLRDRGNVDEILPWEQQFDERAARHQSLGIYDPELVQFRWMIEELRVSLFAQRLGTALPVSAKRLQRQLEKVATG